MRLPLWVGPLPAWVDTSPQWCSCWRPRRAGARAPASRSFAVSPTQSNGCAPPDELAGVLQTCQASAAAGAASSRAPCRGPVAPPPGPLRAPAFPLPRTLAVLLDPPLGHPAHAELLQSQPTLLRQLQLSNPTPAARPQVVPRQLPARGGPQLQLFGGPAARTSAPSPAGLGQGREPYHKSARRACCIS